MQLIILVCKIQKVHLNVSKDSGKHFFSLKYNIAELSDTIAFNSHNHFQTKYHSSTYRAEFTFANKFSIAHGNVKGITVECML